MEKIKVSVCIVTYNHINYISKCLDSLVSQDTDFKFEILVSDDFSTDGTRDVLVSYEARYPTLIKVFLQDKNVGPQANFFYVHSRGAGKYIAHIDGDDYTLPGKLQAQADYLDQNPNCNIVWHRMATLKGDTFYKDNFLNNGIVLKKLDIVDVIANVTIGMNSSKMYRKDFENSEWLDYYDLDFSYNVLKLVNNNKFAAFSGKEILGVYRSSIGISQTHNYAIRIRIYDWLIRFYKDNLIDKSLLNAKILLLLLSDIKHLQKTSFYGFFAFFFTIMNFRVRSVKFIRSRMLSPQNMFEKLDNESII